MAAHPLRHLSGSTRCAMRCARPLRHGRDSRRCHRNPIADTNHRHRDACGAQCVITSPRRILVTMPYAIAATECVRQPQSHAMVSGGERSSLKRGIDPAGILHAATLKSGWTACGLSTEGLHVFDTLDWESTLVAGGRCQECAVAIDDAD